MNEIDARAVRHQGQFIGRFRRVHKAEYETVCKDGEPILFQTEAEAERAAWRAMTAHLTSIMRRDGCTISGNARAAAERLFTRTGHGEEAAQAKSPDVRQGRIAERVCR
jgi:hypothetical protein